MPAKQNKKNPKFNSGARLARSRRERNLTRASVAAHLGASVSDIRNIEQNRWDLLPAGTLANNMIRHYALLLGENPADYETANPDSKLESSSRPLVALSKTTTSLLVLLAMLGISGFLLWRVVAALALPTLNIHQPTQGLVVSQPVATVSGTSSEQAQVFVNDSNVPLDPSGDFVTEVILSPGPNDIKIVAINSFGRQNQQNRTVIYRFE